MRFAYANADEFVKTYCYYCDPEAVFAPTEKVIAKDSDVAFSLELTDGSPMLRGLGVVLECWTTDDNRFGRRGLYIGFSQLTETSEAIHARTQALRRLEEEENTDVTQVPLAPRSRNAPETAQQWGQRAHTAKLDATEVEETDAGEMRKSITQEMEAASPSVSSQMPAVPQPIEEKTSNTTRYEGPLRAPAIPAKRAASPIPSGVALPRTVTPIGAVKLAKVPASQARAGSAATPPPTPVVAPVAASSKRILLAELEAHAAASSGPATPAAASPPAAASLGAEPVIADRGSAPALPPIPIPAARAQGSDPPPPGQMPRGSSPEQQIEPAPAAAAMPPAAITPANESAIPTEPIRVAGSWEDRIAQIRERAADAAQKAWRRAQTTAAHGLQAVRTEATQWREDPRTAAKRWKPTRKAIVVFASGILFGLIVSLFVRSNPPAPKTAAAAPSHPNRIAALFQQPPAAKCTDSKSEEPSLAALSTPPPVVLPGSKSSTKSKAAAHTIAKTPTTKTSTAIAKTQPTAAKTPTAALAKATTTARTQPTAIAKTAQPTTTAKTQPAATAKTQPTAIAKTTQPTTIAKTQPTAIAKTTTTAKTQPTTVAKAPTTTTKTQPATVAKATPPVTSLKTQPTTTAKTAPVQAKTAPATKTAPTKKSGTAACTGLDCI